jgi:hypothetical protein
MMHTITLTDEQWRLLRIAYYIGGVVLRCIDEGDPRPISGAWQFLVEHPVAIDEWSPTQLLRIMHIPPTATLEDVVQGVVLQ